MVPALAVFERMPPGFVFLLDGKGVRLVAAVPDRLPNGFVMGCLKVLE